MRLSALNSRNLAQLGVFIFPKAFLKLVLFFLTFDLVQALIEPFEHFVVAGLEVGSKLLDEDEANVFIVELVAVRDDLVVFENETKGLQNKAEVLVLELREIALGKRGKVRNRWRL